tara:strand:+ start:458 stop:1129 length:672 start_codon:yes stop_codon:yes gene_type:complete
MPQPRRKKIATRRAFTSFKTEEAQIHAMRFKGRTRVIRPIGTRKEANLDLSRHSVFRLLFPGNAITPVGVSSLVEGGTRKHGLVSEIVRGRSHDYKQYQQWVYQQLHSKGTSQFIKVVNEGKGRRPDFVKRHEAFVKELADPISERALDMGIELNTHPVNVCNAGGKPVFFEILSLNLRRLKSVAARMPKSAQRAELEKLIERVRRSRHKRVVGSSASMFGSE